MKNEKIKLTLGRILTLVGCIAAGILIWLIVNYDSNAETIGTAVRLFEIGLR